MLHRVDKYGAASPLDAVETFPGVETLIRARSSDHICLEVWALWLAPAGNSALFAGRLRLRLAWLRRLARKGTLYELGAPCLGLPLQLRPNARHMSRPSPLIHSLPGILWSALALRTSVCALAGCLGSISHGLSFRGRVSVLSVSFAGEDRALVVAPACEALAAQKGVTLVWPSLSKTCAISSGTPHRM